MALQGQRRADINARRPSRTAWRCVIRHRRSPTPPPDGPRQLPPRLLPSRAPTRMEAGGTASQGRRRTWRRGITACLGGQPARIHHLAAQSHYCPLLSVTRPNLAASHRRAIGFCFGQIRPPTELNLPSTGSVRAPSTAWHRPRPAPLRRLADEQPYRRRRTMTETINAATGSRPTRPALGSIQRKPQSA